MPCPGWYAYMQGQYEKEQRAKARAEREAEREYNRQKW